MAPTFAPAGAMWSSANDMLAFLEAAMGSHDAPLRPAFEVMLGQDRPAQALERQLAADAVDVHQAIGWLRYRHGADTVVQHEGAGAGHTASIGYDPDAHIGIVVLSNSYQLLVGDITRHLLQPDVYPLRPAP
jgi:CubicO group peptidase (beta-lactamase class C family)